MLEYGRFKYFVILLVVVLSTLYALPNVYPQDPSVQITANRGYQVDARLKAQVEAELEKAGVAPKSVEQVGCIHTCQGLELDYVGVIIGPDMVFADGTARTDPLKRSSQDKTIRGIRAKWRTDAALRKRADRIIRNTYRTLMTRGMKGCYVYCCDPALASFFRERLEI